MDHLQNLLRKSFKTDSYLSSFKLMLYFSFIIEVIITGSVIRSGVSNSSTIIITALLGIILIINVAEVYKYMKWNRFVFALPNLYEIIIVIVMMYVSVFTFSYASLYITLFNIVVCIGFLGLVLLFPLAISKFKDKMNQSDYSAEFRFAIYLFALLSFILFTMQYRHCEISELEAALSLKG